jgi:TonB family protein
MKRSVNKKTTAMNSMIIYLLQSAAIMAVLYTVFWLFLRNDTFFHVNRVYLMLTLLLSVITPLIDFKLFDANSGSTFLVMLDPILITPGKIEKITSGHLSWFEIAAVIYFTGVAIFTVRFLIQLIQLAMIIHRNKITRHNGANIVFVDRGYSPFSFFNLIFIRQEYYVDGKLTPVLEHEKIHINQFHTLDLIIIELVIILQWFNPFSWFLGRSMKSIHEFLADEGVLRQGFRKSEYQTLILNEAMGLQVNNMTNNFNISLIKNRINMMTKAPSASWAMIKVLAAIPAFLAVIFFFTAGTLNDLSAQDTQTKTTKTQEPTTVTTEKQAVTTGDTKSTYPVKQETQMKLEPVVYQVVEDMPKYPGGDDAMIKYIVSTIKYPEEAKKNGVMGTVYVQYIVETDGSVTHVSILRGVGSGCDEEALRVVQGMPKWIPGKQNGETVRVQFVLPIKFSLDNNKAKPDEGKSQEKIK